jgi:hypothetical protein
MVKTRDQLLHEKRHERMLHDRENGPAIYEPGMKPAPYVNEKKRDRREGLAAKKRSLQLDRLRDEDFGAW